MKKGWITAIFASLVLFSTLLVPASSHAESGPTQGPPQQRTLSVTGQGRIELKPDTATITLGISELKNSPAEAYEAMSASLAKIAGAVQGMGIKEEQIQTGVFNLRAEYNWTQEKGQVLVGYRATTTLSITTQELEKVASLIQAAVEAGANELSGIQFFVKDTEKVLQQALDMAVDDARTKAERVAGRLGAKVGRVVSVSIQDGGVPIFRPVADGIGVAAEAKAAAPAPVFGGTTNFTATVYVTFELE